MNQLSLPCDCAGTCGVALVTEFEEFEFKNGEVDPQEFFVEFYTHYSNDRLRTFKDRLKVAWKILRGKPHYMHSYCWSGPEKPRQLRDFLDKKLKEADGVPTT